MKYQEHTKKLRVKPCITNDTILWVFFDREGGGAAAIKEMLKYLRFTYGGDIWIWVKL